MSGQTTGKGTVYAAVSRDAFRFDGFGWATTGITVRWPPPDCRTSRRDLNELVRRVAQGDFDYDCSLLCLDEWLPRRLLAILRFVLLRQLCYASLFVVLWLPVSIGIAFGVHTGALHYRSYYYAYDPFYNPFFYDPTLRAVYRPLDTRTRGTTATQDMAATATIRSLRPRQHYTPYRFRGADGVTSVIAIGTALPAG